MIFRLKINTLHYLYTNVSYSNISTIKVQRFVCFIESTRSYLHLLIFYFLFFFICVPHNFCPTLKSNILFYRIAITVLCLSSCSLSSGIFTDIYSLSFVK